MADVFSVVPSMKKITFAPVDVLRQTRSVLPSPFMSAAAASFQFKSGTDGKDTVDETVEPLINQTSSAPVLVLRQIRSGIPSPFMSPVATSCQAPAALD